MDLHMENEFIVKDWRVIPPQGLIARGDASEHLEPKVMQVLVYLAARPGQVVPREELEKNVWHGAVISDDAVTATIIKLRKALQDDARQPHIIATIPKKGYQLIAPVAGIDKVNFTLPAPRRLSLPKTGVVIAVAAGALIAMLYMFTPATKPLPPSVIVLPIENLDEGTEHDIFVDGVTEDLITDLSRMSSLMVFASNTTFKYKGRQMTPQALREELNVDYALKGSARRMGDAIRINIQLINTESGFNVWAQRYDRNVTEVFDVQDEITASIVDALAIKLSSQEKQRLARRATSNLAAYQYFLEGQQFSREQTREANAQAREAYLRAIGSDPTYGRAYGALAYTLAFDYRHGWTSTPVENLERALTLADQGVMLDASIPQTHWSLGYVHLRRNEYQQALSAAAESINIAPNYADGFGLLALIHNGLGQPDKALEYARQGMQLNPYYTWDYLFNVGYAHYMLGNYTEAIAALEKAQLRNENVLPTKLILAACYVHADRQADAEWTVEQIRLLNPATTVTHTARTITLTAPEIKQRLLEDLRKAGLPE